MRKTATFSLLVLFISFLIVACSKEPIHSVRVNNQFTEAIDSVKVGYLEYGTIDTGATTEYKSVTVGKYKLSGKTASGLILYGSVEFEEKGTHKWEIIILESGNVGIKEIK